MKEYSVVSRKIIAGGLFSLMLVACGDEAAARKAVLGSLKDPDSAKFGSFTQMEFACLTVNSKNSFGGYVGDQEAFLVKINGEWKVLQVSELTHAKCRELMKQLKEHEDNCAALKEKNTYTKDCPSPD